jgi:nucleoside-diphosphate-sugar epimerase
VYSTGATGYLGGETLYQLVDSATQRNPRLSIRALVRDAHKGNAVKKAFPTHVEIVQGDLDDASLIEQEASEANIVVHLASTKHETSSRAIAKGLATRKDGAGYWIQISGASMFSTPEIQAGEYGKPSEKRYDDFEGVKEVIEVIRTSPARVVDNLVLDQSPVDVKTALLPGPLIYGTGRGPINTRSIQGPEMARYALQNGHAFVVGEGQAAWSNVHVSDVGKLIVLLVEAALDGRDGLWNQEGIYFPENGLLVCCH